MIRHSILFIHHNFPAQFRYLVPWVLSLGHTVIFACDRCPNINLVNRTKNLYIFTTSLGDQDISSLFSDMHRSAERFKDCFLRISMEKHEFKQPDSIICHSGWGAGVFAKDFFPNAKIISYLEWWFKATDEEFTYTEANYPWTKPYDDNFLFKQTPRNYTQAVELLNSDYIVSPTYFQSNGLPKSLVSKTHIIYDLVDSAIARPLATRFSQECDSFVLTYATRGLEPMRGFPEFILATCYAIKHFKNLQVVIAGNDKSYYLSKPKNIKSFKQWAESTIESFNLTNHFKFVGTLPNNQYINLLQKSNLHIYLTRPFVPSWSLLDAMSIGTSILASDVTPTREICHPVATYWTDHRKHEVLLEDLCNAIEEIKKTGAMQQYKRIGLPSRELVKSRHSKAEYFYKWAKLLSFENIG